MGNEYKLIEDILLKEAWKEMVKQMLVEKGVKVLYICNNCGLYVPIEKVSKSGLRLC